MRQLPVYVPSGPIVGANLSPRADPAELSVELLP